MTEEATATALAQAASTLREAARVHKRSEAQHRRQARELMQEYDRLRAVCSEHGISLIESTDPPKEESQL